MYNKSLTATKDVSQFGNTRLQKFFPVSISVDCIEITVTYSKL